ncbi:MAG: class I SAM-dependent methyltransferase [Planctomycetales bacterium]|nr:class I SAM-dependent methyltransferase [Planctomycetales bacterium]
MQVLSPSRQDVTCGSTCDNSPLIDRATATRRPSLLSSLRRKAVLSALRRIRHGQVTIGGAGVRETFGSAGNGLSARVEVLDDRFFSEVLWGGSLGAAEAYRQGYWRCDDLVSLIRILARNRDALASLGVKTRWLMAPAQRLRHCWHRNSQAGSRRNIAAHYDLSNAFFATFLDPTMTYSSGIFSSPQSTMEEASVEKYDRICRVLRLTPKDRVLEIGTGWGGFAEHAARHYGCHVTTTTISAAQHEYAAQRFDQSGLDDRITLLRHDYRALQGQFDKLVSIEMIEAVGYEYLDTYFRQCARLLKPTGSMLLQAITMPDQGYRHYLKSVDFIQRYIFPGGCLPSLGAICDSVRRVTDFRVTMLDDFAQHYARTLQLWRAEFFRRLDEIRELGMDDVFIRTWDFYFCYCEGAFCENLTGVAQILLEKPGCRRYAENEEESA